MEGREQLGFTLAPRRSRRHPAKTLTDLDYADDIAALSDCMKDAQELLCQLETAAAEVGLYINSKKTQCINYNQPKGIITAIDGGVIKEVEDYKYLGAWISSSKKDFTTRRARAWDIAHKLKPLWTSKMPRATKVGVLTAAVESVLLYGSESWTLTAALTKRLDGLYTRLLRFALNITWRDKWTNVKLYQGLPKISEKLRGRRMRLAGHLIRHPEEAAHETVLWEPLHGNPKRGAPSMNYVKLLKKDTGLDNVSEIRTVMEDRDGWRERTRRTSSSTGRGGRRETLLLKMFDDISKKIQKDQTVVLILLDLSAAFDTIDHTILAKKLLDDYGISGMALLWLQSYLKNRTYCVKIGDTMSSVMELLFGVP